MGLYTIFLLHTHYRKPYFFPGFPCFFTIVYGFSGFPGFSVSYCTIRSRRTSLICKISGNFQGFSRAAGSAWLRLRATARSACIATRIAFTVRTRYYSDIIYEFKI